MPTFALLLLWPLGAHAQLVVNWGGDYVPGPGDQLLDRNTYSAVGVDGDGDTAADDAVAGILFSATQLMSPNSGYGPPLTGQSPNFYGGAITTWKDSAGPASLAGEVSNQGPNDSIHLHLQNTAQLKDLHAVFLWKQADFLTGNSPITLEAQTQVSLAIGSTNTENLVGAQARLLVQEGGVFWVSQAAFTSPTANSAFTWQGFSASSDGAWVQYDPTKAFAGQPAGSDLRFDQSVMFSDQNFTAITAIGFLFEQDTFHNNIDFHLESFTVTVVPEPSAAFGVLVGLVVIVVGGIWRHRKTRFGSPTSPQ